MRCKEHSAVNHSATAAPSAPPTPPPPHTHTHARMHSAGGAALYSHPARWRCRASPAPRSRRRSRRGAPPGRAAGPAALPCHCTCSRQQQQQYNKQPTPHFIAIARTGRCHLGPREACGHFGTASAAHRTSGLHRVGGVTTLDASLARLDALGGLPGAVLVPEALAGHRGVLALQLVHALQGGRAGGSQS